MRNHGGIESYGVRKLLPAIYCTKHAAYRIINEMEVSKCYRSVQMDIHVLCT